MYNDYTAYLGNQRAIFSKLSDIDFDDLTMVEILNDSGNGVVMKRPLDRPALKSVNDSYKLIGVEGRAVIGTLETDEDKMKSLVRRWRVTGNAGRVGRLFRRMMATDDKKMESGMVRELFNNDQTYNALTSNHGMEHRLVFIKIV